MKKRKKVFISNYYQCDMGNAQASTEKYCVTTGQARWYDQTTIGENKSKRVNIIFEDTTEPNKIPRGARLVDERSEFIHEDFFPVEKFYSENEENGFLRFLTEIDRVQRMGKLHHKLYYLYMELPTKLIMTKDRIQRLANHLDNLDDGQVLNIKNINVTSVEDRVHGFDILGKKFKNYTDLNIDIVESPQMNELDRRSLACVGQKEDIAFKF